MSLKHHPLHAAFLLIAEEYDRSVILHKPWEGYRDKVMLKAIKGEVAELDLAIEMDDEIDTLREAVHSGNVCAKMVAEILRRKG